MTITAIQGAFNTGTGAVGTTIDLTGVAGANFLFCWWSGELNTTDAATAQTARPGQGFANGSDRYCVTGIIINAAATMDASAVSYNNAVVTILLNTTSIDGALDIDSWISGGVRLIVDNQFSQSYRIHYILANIPNVKVGTFDFPTSGATVSVSGLSFQPEAGIFLLGSYSSFGTIHTDYYTALGFSSGVNNNGVVSTYSVDATPNSSTRAYCYSGECIAAAIGGTDITARAKLSSWNSTGFTLSILENPGIIFPIAYAVFEGAEFLVGDLLTQTDTTTDINETVGFETKVCIIASHNQGQSTQNLGQNVNSLSVGAFVSDTSEGTQGIYDENSASTSSSTTVVDHDSCYVNLDINDAVEGLMHCTSITTTGFTLRMTDADPTQAFCIYFAMGDITVTKNYPFTGKHKILFEGSFG